MGETRRLAMTTDLQPRILARLDQLLARLGGLVDADPARELAPVPGDLYNPPSWPEGLPWPLSARQALDAVSGARELLADWIAADIDAAVAALVKPEVHAAALASPDLVAGWRWPLLTAAMGNGAERCGPSYGPRLALGRLVRSWHADLDPVDVGRWPDGALSHRSVAEWAREPLNRLHPAKPADFKPYMGLDPEAFAALYPGKPALGDILLVDVEAYGEILHIPVLRQASGWPVELHRTTLALLYLVERDALADLPGNLMRAAWLTVRSWASETQGDVHGIAARTALEREAAPAEAADLLARKVHEACAGLVESVAPTPDPPAFDPQMVPERDGMLRLDADLADWLATLDQGEADKVRAAACERLTHYASELDARHLFERWTDGTTLRLVARILWRRHSSPGLQVRGVRSSGDIYSTAPRLVATMAWALGGAGKAAPVDGDDYREAPAVVRYLPRVATLRDLSKRPPAQRALPVEVDAPAEVQVVADAQFVVSPAAAKVALAMLTLAPPDGDLVRGTLGELGRLVKPEGRIQGRDLEQLATGLHALRSLALVLPDETSVTLFNDIRGPSDPRSAKTDHVVEWSLSRVATAVTSKGGEWPGRFLFNFSGAMRLSAKTESAHLRAYLVCAALWNSARFGVGGELDPERVPRLGLDGWADRFNLLSPTALESTSPAHRVKLSESRKATRQTLEELCDKHGLLTLEKVGKDAWRPLPPPALVEAYRILRKQGGRLL